MAALSSMHGFVVAGAIAAAALVWPHEAYAANVVRQPYLQIVTPSSAVVVWTTSVPTDSLVRYGKTPQSLDQMAPLAEAAIQHEVTLSGLEPATRYFYSIGSASGALEGGDVFHSFVTAPKTGSRDKLRAWIVGDSGVGCCRQFQVRDAMLNFVGTSRPDMFLHLGDMAYASGTAPEFTKSFFGAYSGILLDTPVWPTLGNHEGYNSDSDTQTGPYYDAYVLPKAGEAGGLPSGTEAYYSFDWGNVHFIVLDSHDSPRAVDGPMMTWMKADLAATNQEWIIAFWHHPPYSKGTHDSDIEAQLTEMRTNALPILEAGGVDLVLAGHSHIYERSYLVDGAYDTPTTVEGHVLDSGDGKALGNGSYEKNPGGAGNAGAVYVVAGHGGATLGGKANHPLMYFSELDNGSCILDIHENRLSMKNIRYDGVVTDDFSLVKGSGLVIGAPDGGEALVPGQSYEIRWDTVGSFPEVTLELSTDGGATFAPIAQAIPNFGSYHWTVPNVDTSRALVRIRGGASTDESNGQFSITPSPTLPKRIYIGELWRYDDTGADRGSSWIEPSYEDSAWKEGHGQFGYGEGDEGTEVFDADPPGPTVYFRKKFTLEGKVSRARVIALHDAGVAVWINGTPVLSKYMDNGTAFDVYASETSAKNELSSADISLARDPFVVGENVIAAMVKRSDPAATSLSFDLELGLAPETDAPKIPPSPGDLPAGTPAKTGLVDGACACGFAGQSKAPAFFLGLGLLGLARRFGRRERRSALRDVNDHPPRQ